MALEKIVRELNAKGIKILKTYPYGVIIGTGEASMVTSLRKMDWIEDVSVEDVIQLPPHDSPIQ